jgi:hypothetical protein
MNPRASEAAVTPVASTSNLSILPSEGSFMCLGVSRAVLMNKQQLFP